MNKPLSFYQRLLFLGILATIMFAVWFGIAMPIRNAFGDIDTEIQAATATKARVERTINQLETTPQTTDMPKGVVWAGASVNLIQADFQQQLGAFSAQNQVTFNSITPLSIGDVSETATVALRIEGTSGYANLLKFIDTALSNSPQIAISAFSIRQLPAQQNTPKVSVSFQITFWAAIDVRDPE